MDMKQKVLALNQFILTLKLFAHSDLFVAKAWKQKRSNKALSNGHLFLSWALALPRCLERETSLKTLLGNAREETR